MIFAPYPRARQRNGRMSCGVAAPASLQIIPAGLLPPPGVPIPNLWVVVNHNPPWRMKQL
jgi:hypothetical protein